jgi:AraC-like DNA-binding protein
MGDAEELRTKGDDLARLVDVLSQAITQAAVVVDLLRRALIDVEGVDDVRAWRQQLMAALSSARGKYSREVHRALRYLEAHYDEDISLARLARVADCSRRHLAEAFRRETGETVHSYLVRVRLMRAAMHVRAGDKIEAVMLGVGFRGKRNFYRLFKARFGATPCEYREREGEGGTYEVNR